MSILPELQKNRLLFVYIFLLVGVAVAAHGNVIYNDFISYDDSVYVYLNDNVREGLTPHSIAWSFGTVKGGAWHPLVWLSHMLVVSFGGLDPLWHHGCNLILHIFNAVLFFLLLYAATGAALRSAIAAAFFAVHPIHVESVAWISERKDVLSMFFGLLTLHGYLRYARSGSRGWHNATFFGLLLGLMAKPMLVTLPLLFLLLDFWPLQRVQWGRAGTLFSANKQLVWEKIGFFLVSCCAAGLTVYAQKHGGALAPLQDFSFWQRLANVATSYVAYCGKLLWPADLALLYPLRASIPVWKSSCSALLLCLLTAASINYARRVPYCFTGWFWFLVALLPVVGLIQVGVQAMADRYAYFSFLGLYVLLAWGGSDLVNRYARSRRSKLLVVVAVCLVLAFLMLKARRQNAYWRDSITLFKHTLAVTKDNYQVHRMLAQRYNKAGSKREALQEIRAALRIRPDAYGHWLLAYQLMFMGKNHEAISHCRKALQLFPENAKLHKLFGVLLYHQGKLKQAKAAFTTAAALAPNDTETRKNLRIVEKELEVGGMQNQQSEVGTEQ